MPAARLSRRRRSSYTSFSPDKIRLYSSSHLPPRPVTFAPNVTPVTFVETEDDDDMSALLENGGTNLTPLTSSLLLDGSASKGMDMSKALFPPSANPLPPPARKRCPPGKRRSQGYIPRPPNAFMLFRAEFVRQKHVPGSIETNHGSLSKIIGTCWRQLPLEEKKIWELKAKKEKAEHKIKYPDYRFRPVHNKNKASANSASSSSKINSSSDDVYCNTVAQFLLDGKKGEELAEAVRDQERKEIEEGRLERQRYQMEFGSGGSRKSSYSHSLPVSRSNTPNILFPQEFMPVNNNNSAMFHRRSSSVPLPNEFFIPNSFFNVNNAFGPSLISPVANISRMQQQQQQYTAQGSFLQVPNPDQIHANPFQFDNPLEPLARQHAPFTGMHHHAPTFSGSFNFDYPYLPNAMGTGSARNSLGLGLRRASSAQAMLTRSWTYPLAPSPADSLPLSFDLSPLPDVDPALFGNFTFDKAASSPIEEMTTFEVDPACSVPIADTANGTPIMSPAGNSQPSSAYSGSPALSLTDILPELGNVSLQGKSTEVPSTTGTSIDFSSYLNMDSMEFPNMEMGFDMYEFEGYGEPVESQSFIHSPLPIRTPTAIQDSFIESS